MKTFFLIFIGIAFNFCIYCQEGSFGPVNPKFINYLDQQKQSRLKSATEIGANFGYTPSPVLHHFISYGKTENSSKLKSTQFESLPQKFDLRDSGWVTPIKNQSLTGTCWAFATIASVESNWLVNDFGSYDLSEQNLAACNGINRGYNNGGMALYTNAYFSRLSGPILEKDDPFNPKNTSCRNASFLIPKYVIGSKFLPPDNDLIKKYIMKYGGIYATMRAGNDVFTCGNDTVIKPYCFDEYFNPDDNTYFYYGTLSPNHAVLLVGWDNNKVVTGGTKSPKGTKGAWIVKNSWGNGFGENGYFYLSYFDQCSLDEVGFFDQTINPNEIDTVLMYDPMGVSNSYGFQNKTCYGLTKFTAVTQQEISRVGTYIVNGGTTIDVEIYKAFTNNQLQDLVFSKKNIFCEFPGQTTFDVNVMIEGDYYVKIKYISTVSGFPLAVETNKGGFWVYDYCKIVSPGINWVSVNGTDWLSAGKGIPGRELNLTIRSYNKFNSGKIPKIVTDQHSFCIHDSIKVTVIGTNDEVNYQWNLGSDAEPKSYLGISSFYVKYKTKGKKAISLIIDNGEKTDTVIKNIEVYENLPVEIISISENTPMNIWDKDYFHKSPVVGQNLYLIASIAADSFKWSSPYDTCSSSRITIKILNEGPQIFYVKAYSNGCSGSDSLTIIAKPNQAPVNDSICNAIEIKEGINGPYSNQYATTEAHEPFPSVTSCNSQTTWCQESGVQNSLWFWITAPESGIVSVTADGFDSQLALYKAENADSLIQGKYKLVAANDDYTGNLPAIVNAKVMVPEKKYYLQLDGSAGGAIGSGKITIIYDLLTITTNKDTLRLNASEGACDSLTIKANTDWNAYTNVGWLTVIPSNGPKNGNINLVTKSANLTGEIRKGKLTINMHNLKSISIPVIQYREGVIVNGLTETNYIKILNPVKEILKIMVKNNQHQRYNIYNIQGQAVMSGILLEGLNNISVCTLHKGIYLIKTSGIKGSQAQKFVKE